MDWLKPQQSSWVLATLFLSETPGTPLLSSSLHWYKSLQSIFTFLKLTIYKGGLTISKISTTRFKIYWLRCWQLGSQLLGVTSPREPGDFQSIIQSIKVDLELPGSKRMAKVDKHSHRPK